MRTILKSDDKVEEIRLVNLIQQILNAACFGFPNIYINEQIYQNRRWLLYYMMMIDPNLNATKIDLIKNGVVRVPPIKEISTEEIIKNIEYYLKKDTKKRSES